MISIRRLATSLVALTVALGLTACSSDSDEAASAGTIKVGWQYSTQMPLMAVRILGMEGDSDLDIQWTRFDNGPATFPALARGDVDIAHMGAGAAITAIGNGLDVTIIGVGQEFTKAEGLIVSEKSGIQAAADLVNKKIGVVVGSSGYFGLTKVLETEGLTIDDIEVVNMQFAQMVPAYEAGDVDAVYVAEPYRSRVIAAGGTQLLTTADMDDVAVATADTSPWIVRTEFLEQHPEAVREFIRLNEIARERYESDQSITDRVNEQVSTELNMTPDQVELIASFAEFPSIEQQADSTNFYAIGEAQGASTYRSSLESLAQLLVDFGSLKKMPDIAGHVDGSVIDDLAKDPSAAGGA